MFKLSASGLRLFLLSFCLTLVAAATLWGFVVVHRHMQEMGMAPEPIPVGSNIGEGPLGLTLAENLGVSTDVLVGLEQLRRRADPLTLPRSVRLGMRVYLLLGQRFIPGF